MPARFTPPPPAINGSHLGLERCPFCGDAVGEFFGCWRALSVVVELAVQRRKQVRSAKTEAENK